MVPTASESGSVSVFLLTKVWNMTYKIVDLDTWPRASQFRLFKTYDRSHYATTVRLDVTHLVTRRKQQGVSPYRA